MASGVLAYQMLARHGAAIERLRHDMIAETDRDGLLQFLAYEAASFAYAFLIATGNDVSPQDRALRNEMQEAILAVLAARGIDRTTFRVWPDIDPPSG